MIKWINILCGICVFSVQTIQADSFNEKNKNLMICPMDALVSCRPSVEKRLFKSSVIETEILRVQRLLTNKKLACMFGNCFPNTLDTTVHFRTD